MPVNLLRETPSQTAGPYVHIGLVPSVAGIQMRTQENLHVVAGPQTDGEAIKLEIDLWDGTGAPVTDAVIELWQADGQGRYRHPLDPKAGEIAADFRGFGRAASDLKSGHYVFETVKPGAVAGPDGSPMAPHVALTIFSRGINIHLNTRIYFADEEANAQDPILQLVPPPRRDTLMAARKDGGGTPTYAIDIRLQGENETVFFDV
ncbi:protocatechuate 3,4-dioxygenase subunit alpha [Amorphus orientalis]|uniref:Protocatechuate 3,4-dioxygenase alpha subunit n=1 Tax=Amorphus orientalis TaxID=649198 RepID=A0AAE3VU68_9HYPH|nr:protocatechuate 3,4-dioxygenase subunit alpha [Amorphus orientalis]MDQ0317676.1 protocatechuate 3,4-dioxygenase alpha subunit [Amorphus orientalis]